MSDDPGTATIIPTLRYGDAKAAITFLCKAFGFEEALVVPGEGDSIAAGGREAPRGRFGIDGYKSIEAKRALMSATVTSSGCDAEW